MDRGRVVEREKRKGAGGQGVFWMEAAVRGGWWGGMERGVERAKRVGRAKRVERAKRVGRRWSGCMFLGVVWRWADERAYSRRARMRCRSELL